MTALSDKYMDICASLSAQLYTANETIKQKDRFIATLQNRIDKQNAELDELRQLVGVHKDECNNPFHVSLYPHRDHGGKCPSCGKIA